MRNSLSPVQWIVFAAILIVLLVIIQVELIKFAADKLGLSTNGMLLLLFVSLMGSLLNMPLFRIRSDFDPEHIPDMLKGIIDPSRFKAGNTLIAVNVGGAVIPVCFSIFLFLHHQLPIIPLVACIAAITAISYFFSRPVANIGIGMPFFLAPISAAVIALILAPDYRAPVAYICGTLGVLVGADLFRLHTIRQMSIPVASIGGAGTFDGIFLTGFVAVLLS